ncbi:MAG: ABC transporter ATP-binding protein [Paludibacteraceae bacterium]|nr:ABC transporter ATP-binding protein [Paludibacteraceae bacterium]
MSESRLLANDLTIGYSEKKGQFKAVQRHLNLSLDSHQMTALIGPNGAGKSTLLRTICGLQKQIQGEILIKGKSIDHLSTMEKAKLISVVLTHSADTSMLTVREIVSIGRQPYSNWLGLKDIHHEEMIEKALSTVNISHLAKRQLAALSDGEKQRVWIAKALAQDTPIILLDEPTSHLDYKNRIEIFKLLHRLSASGKSILISTHELDLAIHFADQLWVMEDGVTQGDPQTIYDSGILERTLGYTKDARQIGL